VKKQNEIMETSNETESSSSSSNTIIVNNNNSSATLSNEVDDHQQADLNFELEKIKNASLSQIESYLKADPSTILPASLE
jgi:hypothetical protein